ncbi:MAG: flagellin [Methanomicrobiales archaeon]|nr:flagellin [Methanomicrobiales archaeon]
MTRTINRNDAFTGLEAAIVLIAFVVVAAVFAYVVLGAGFFTTQKSQEVVHSGVQQATTNMNIAGEVYGDASGTSETVETDGPPRVHAIIFTITLAAGGSPIDLNKTSFVFSNSSVLRTLDFGSGAVVNGTNCNTNPPGGFQWSICGRQNDDFDTVLEVDEKFTIWANISGALGTLPSESGIPTRDSFNLEIKPPLGASLGITRKTDAAIDKMNVLY